MYSGYFVDEGNYLMHYGVLGMKWGIRRYQNADGTLTSAGRKHYGKALYKKEKALASNKLEKQYAKGKYLTEGRNQTVAKNRVAALGKYLGLSAAARYAGKVYVKRQAKNLENLNMGAVKRDLILYGAASLAASGYAIGMLVNTHKKNKAIKTYKQVNEMNGNTK